jgi:hypothetical protein
VRVYFFIVPFEFADELKIIYEENIPESKSMSRKYDPSWINEESKIALVKKRKLWTKYRYNLGPIFRSNLFCSIVRVYFFIVPFEPT